MSWLFSRALVGAFSAATYSAGAASALLNGTPTPRAYLPPAKMTDFSRPSRFGMTFGPLTDGLGEDLLTWFLADFLAKTSASPERVTDWTASDPASGPKWRGSLARYDPDLRSWKTAQHSLLGDSDEYSETWPRWGTTVGGELYLLPTPELRTGGSESGLWPTPVASDLGMRTKKYGQGGTALSLAAMTWPTPTTRDRGSDAPNRTGGPSLGVAVRNTATLIAQAAGGVPTQPMTLNPEWVEWLQGWPRMWTALSPLVTDKSPKPPRSPGAP